MHRIELARVYDERLPEGRRFLVDRVWPRGVRKEDLNLEAWLKDLAPSTELRRWFGHDPARFAEFAERYRAELADNPALDDLLEEVRGGTVTLLYAAKDEQVTHARVLADVVAERLAGER